MEKIYRIASVLIMAAAMFLLSFLLLPLYVAAARLGISPWFVQLSIFGGLLLYAWWFMIWNDAQSEPQKDSRLQSVLVWFGTIAIVYAVFSKQRISGGSMRNTPFQQENGGFSPVSAGRDMTL